MIACKGFDVTDVAERFVSGFMQQPGRGYGGGVVDVFKKLDAEMEEGGGHLRGRDVLAPAKDQFDGTYFDL